MILTMTINRWHLISSPPWTVKGFLIRAPSLTSLINEDVVKIDTIFIEIEAADAYLTMSERRTLQYVHKGDACVY